jgi:hypothetical protein
MEKKKISGLFVLVVFELIFLVLILISSLYQQGVKKELYAMIEEGKPSSTTETVLPPLPHFRSAGFFGSAVFGNHAFGNNPDIFYK